MEIFIYIVLTIILILTLIWGFISIKDMIEEWKQ